MFLKKTVDDLLKNMRGDTEIIIGADGVWPDPPMEDNPKVHMIYHPVSVGQRAITNECAKLSRAKYLMKVDAHCAFDEGFDVKMIEKMQPDWTMVPVMRNLHVFDWVCKKCKHRRYQGPTPTSCPQCDNTTEFERDVVWIAKRNPQSTAYCFDPEPHFQYFRDFKNRPEGKGELTETMSLQGSCFMVDRSRYFDLDMSEETFGSWGSQGIEVACKSWLSGGRVVVNHKTWYAHLFRTQGGDFGFPWDCSGRQVEKAKHYAKDLFFNNKWPKQVKPMSWLIDKFWPVPGWTEDDRLKLKGGDVNAGNYGILPSMRSSVKPIGDSLDMSNGLPPEKPLGARVAGPSNKRKGLLYYTDNRLDETIMKACQDRTKNSSNGHKIVSVSLRPIGFGQNITLDLQRGHLAMAKQQLAGLEALDTDIVFMVEHDILYPKCHFSFVPPREDVFYYNLNWVKVRTEDGQALHFKAKQVSGLCAHRNILLDYFRNRVKMIESGEIGGRRHFEPGSHYRDAYRKLTNLGFETWFSEIPYVDIRHGNPLTRNIFDPSGYKNQVIDWQLMDSVPGWGYTKGRFWDFLKDVIDGKIP
jgi:hypothetical protein